MNSIKACLVGAALVSAILISPEVRANLVVNGGFETASFFGWTQIGDTNFDGVGPGPADAHSGFWSAFFGTDGATTTLSQNIATTAGQTYEVSFFL